jgi:outer membrane protein, heavy metal efflux system
MQKGRHPRSTGRRQVVGQITGKIVLTLILGATGAEAPRVLTMDEAVGIAVERSKDLIAARLEVESAEVERIAARFYPNPFFSYTLGNIVIPHGNEQGPMGANPGPFDQTIHTFALSAVLDVWFKRSARTDVADRGIDEARTRLEDVMREIVHTVRSAFADVVREQEERRLAKETLERYDETVRISHSRYKAGDISEADLKKIELEGLKYKNQDIDAALQLDLARNHLASLMLLPSANDLPEVEEKVPLRPSLAIDALTARALEERPDVRSLRAAHKRAEAQISAQDREALPDPSIGVAYTRDYFTVSGDNPNSLSLQLSIPIPVLDRNQAGRARAAVDFKKNENDAARLEIIVRREVAESVRKTERSRTLLDVYEGGMLERSESALKTAEKSYQIGAISLLELLEAQRTYIETRAEYLKTLSDYRQATIDVSHAVGGDLR